MSLYKLIKFLLPFEIEKSFSVSKISKFPSSPTLLFKLVRVVIILVFLPNSKAYEKLSLKIETLSKLVTTIPIGILSIIFLN